MVSDLLLRESKEWNHALVKKLLPELAEHIFSIRPSITGMKDTYIWTQQNTGNYSAKSGYYATQKIKTQSTISLLGDPNWNWQKLIWNPKLLPKIKMFMWRCAINNLPTGDNLRKRGLLGHTSCAKCGAEETLEHILFRCTTAKETWELCPWSTPLDPLVCSSFRSTLQSSFSKVNLPPMETSVNLFAWICWSLWLNKNQLTFENKQASPQEIITKSVALAKEWERSQVKSPPPIVKAPPQIPPQISSPSSIVCYTDAAWRKDTKEADLAWIFTTCSGFEITRGCLHQLHVSSAIMAEALAVRAALSHASALNFFSIWLRSDSKGLIQAISSNHRSVEFLGVLSDIESSLLSLFSSFYASFIPRSLNGPADSYAKASLCYKLSVLGLSPH
ncbi:uncharacterized protein LOC130495880 [Raphanus sativus]|uniref:Uncharacterized protein LOC130495880 n=1 Tax=Raphanus sativus TaxID=3726 RepID=A0A9W3BW72_RAPSA|nr:uncharacterized protein LOC130495880 [Raphanus sativus]